MKVYGVIGWKNAGKTGLMERLVAEITRRGLSVSTVKHVHHDVDLDQPGKDTFRHRAAGAREVVLASAQRHAILTEHRGPEPELAAILARLAPVDLVLVEGYKRDAHPKIEVFREATGQALLQPGDPLVRAIATDAALPDQAVPVLDLNDTAAIADFVLRETGLLPDPATLFDTVVVVDWSSSGTPSPARPSANAIWLGVAQAGGVTAHYLRTRADAERMLTGLLDTEAAAGRRVLAGFDFPFGYPAGFAARLTGTPGARAVWRWLAERIEDGPDNRNNRFLVADAANRSLGGSGPFWGRPRSLPLACLPECRTAGHSALGLAERRRVEETAVPRAQPGWKLYTAGSAGGQSLTGLPVIHRLSQRAGARVWPFDRIDGATLVLAEVYPSLLEAEVRAQTLPGRIRDDLQVRLLAQALFALSQAGKLGLVLDTVPEWPGRGDEGWILGAGQAALLRQALR
ncbi:MAG: molybdopterin-guanine dinucleotide biosynthesis protein B [Cereibacter sp.]